MTLVRIVIIAPGKTGFLNMKNIHARNRSTWPTLSSSYGTDVVAVKALTNKVWMDKSINQVEYMPRRAKLLYENVLMYKGAFYSSTNQEEYSYDGLLLLDGHDSYHFAC